MFVCAALCLMSCLWSRCHGLLVCCRVFCFHRGLPFRFYAEGCKYTRQGFSIVLSPSRTRLAGACFHHPALRQMTAAAEDRCGRGAPDRSQRFGRGPLRERTASGDRALRPCIPAWRANELPFGAMLQKQWRIECVPGGVPTLLRRLAAVGRWPQMYYLQ